MYRSKSITLMNVLLFVLLFLPQLSYAVIIYGQIDGYTGATEETGFPPNTPWTWSFSYDSDSAAISADYSGSGYISREYEFLDSTSGILASEGLTGPALIGGIYIDVDTSTNTLMNLELWGSGTSEVLQSNGDRIVKSTFVSITSFDVSSAGYQFIENDPLNIQMDINPGGCLFCGAGVFEKVYDSGGNLISSHSVDGEIGQIERIFLTTVPVPSAVWLFGSGLIGLIGMARRKKA